MLLELAIMALTAGHHVNLNWEESTPQVEFNIYRSYQGPDGPWRKLNVSSPWPYLTYSDWQVRAGRTYWYYVTAVSGGMESAPSEVAEATVPTP